MMLKNYNEGDNVLLLNTLYVRPHPTDTGKWSKGTLYLTYRDLDTGEKMMDEIVDPVTHTYVTKPEFRKDFNTQRAYMPFDKVEKVEVPYRAIQKKIRDIINEDGVDKSYVKIFDEATREGKKRLRNEVFKWRHNYYGDYDITDYATTHAYLTYKPKSMYITKSFLDIEVDIYNRTEEEKLDAACPINAVSVVIDHEPDGTKAKKPYVFTFLLRDYNRYPQQEEFENNLDSFYDKCKKEFKRYGGINYKVKLFDDEIEMLKTLFGLIHFNKSDFIHIWNMAFDVPYITKRLQYLGYDPIDFFSHPDFNDPYMFFYLDVYHKNDFANRVDYFDLTSYSRWIDQLTLYANIRKAKSDYGGVSLDNVSKIELKAEKRVYDGKDVDVINGAIREYSNFVLYSINDVLLQLGIDRKTSDTNTLMDQSYTGGTRISKTLKQSVYLKNVYAIEYFNMNLVPKNNCNIDYSKEGSQEDGYDNVDLTGALVGDPSLNAENGMMIFGKPSKYMMKLLIDFDQLRSK